MTFDPTKPVQTRDGRKARILCTDLKGDSHPIRAAVMDEAGAEAVLSYHLDGRYAYGGDENRANLVNIPVKHSTYRNVYVDDGTTALDQYTRKTADTIAKTVPRLGVLRIDYEDGVRVNCELEKI